MTSAVPPDIAGLWAGQLVSFGRVAETIPGCGPQLVAQVGTLADAPPVKLIFPPWVEKIGGISRDFYGASYELTLPASGTVVLPAVTMPSDQVGWLQQFSAYVLSPVAATRITYTLRVNQGPVAGFDNYRMIPGVANFILLDNDDLRVPVPQGGSVDVLITNGRAVAETVGAKVAGWYHPLAAELAVWGPCR